MNKFSISIDQVQLRCPVCMDLLKDPVTIPCGHSYCKVCINYAWKNENVVYSCPVCRTTFTSRPVLHKAVMLAEMMDKLKKNEPQAAVPAHCYAGPGDVECDSCTGRKRKAVNSCLVCLASFCEDHLQPHYQSPAFKKHELVKACTDLQKKICSKHNKLMEISCHNDESLICYLCMMAKHKDQLSVQVERTEKQKCSPAAVSYRESYFTELINPMSRNNIKIHPQAAAAQTFLTPEPRSREAFLQYFCLLTLDPNTTNPELILSEKNRAVTRSNMKQNYSDLPERFDSWPQVLCKESVCGRCYWEVECSGNVDISVCYKDISRKGGDNECLFGYNNKSWSLDCFSSSFSFWHNNSVTELQAPEFSKIGVYVDYSAGTLSFYKVSDTMKLLHRFHTTFTRPLYAGFGVHYESFLRLL